MTNNMTSPTIQLEPGKSISLEKLKRILEKVEELKKIRELHIVVWDKSWLTLSVDNLLEVYEDE